ncbi:MAG: hypothetical protein J7551_01750 [Chloroflexi bacterium]|jgi:hypothetical protein|nr:hypothetical protein [Chloroflexota bacterium]
MTQLVYLIEQIAPAIYLFCAAGVLFWLGRFFAAQAGLRAAEFELERELEEQRRARALTWTIGLVELGLGTLAIATVVAPTLRADLLSAGLPIAPESGAEQRFVTSTPGGDGNDAESIFLTVTAQALSGGAFLQLTAVASPTPVGTVIAGYPTPIGCNSEQAALEVPANGMRVFDTLTVVGTAYIPDFAFYTLEISGPSTGGEFGVLDSKTSPMPQKGVLGQFAVAAFQPGDYRFRLAVFDSLSEMRASCTVWIVISPRPPTNTPPGG